MSTHAESVPLPLPVLGMVLFISSETMFFGGLFAAYFSLRDRAGEWPPAGAEPSLALALGLTAALASSSFAVARGERAWHDGRRGAALRWIAATIALGCAFLAGQLYEYSDLAFTFADHPYGTLFLTITGFHGLHVAAGVVMLALALVRLRLGGERADRTLVPAAYYWHFVDGIWLVLVATLYVMR